MSTSALQSSRGLVVAISTCFALALGLSASGVLVGCNGDKKPESLPRAPSRAALRVFALGGAAGAIEPCGCVKDMLGGVDHAAAFIESSRGAADAALVLGAGSMLFADPVVPDARRAQSLFKADAMSASLSDLELTAWAPGLNDFALGRGEFERLGKAAHAAQLAGNVRLGGGALSGHQLVKAGGHLVGLAGVSVLTPALSPHGAELRVEDAAAALARSHAELAKAGAELFVALVAAGRGDALRLAEKVPGYQLLIVGRAVDQGDANDAPQPALVVGETLVVQAQNHLQSLAVVDLFIAPGDFGFADGVGLEALEKRAALERKKRALERRVGELSGASGVAAERTVTSLRGELVKLDEKLAKLPVAAPPTGGSYFRYQLADVRESVGSSPLVEKRLVAYYERVNEHNRQVFASEVPAAVPAGQSGYVGAAACATCHQEEYAFWKTTRHEHAYETLSVQHKEFNLDCVSCHVTGYGKPGGSTVTHVEKLTDVQCETCHGPGSRHGEKPKDPTLIQLSPERTLCAECHHPPHVHDDWSVDLAWPQILGKGHGYGR